MKYDDRMDPECIELCDALNGLPGIRTIESCCGHGKEPFRVFFIARGDIQSVLMPIVSAIESSGWKLEAYWSNGGNFVVFCLRSHATDTSAGDELASWIIKDGKL